MDRVLFVLRKRPSNDFRKIVVEVSHKYRNQFPRWNSKALHAVQVRTHRLQGCVARCPSLIGTVGLGFRLMAQMSMPVNAHCSTSLAGQTNPTDEGRRRDHARGPYFAVMFIQGCNTATSKHLFFSSFQKGNSSVLICVAIIN